MARNTKEAKMALSNLFFIFVSVNIQSKYVVG